MLSLFIKKKKTLASQACFKGVVKFLETLVLNYSCGEI